MTDVPAAYLPAQGKVIDCESELEGLNDERNNANPPLNSAQKAALGKKINRALADLERARTELKACIALQDPPQPVNPQLIILDIEAVNSVQRRGNLMRLAQGRSAIVRIFVSSGITNGFDSGFGPGRWGGVAGMLRVVDADTGLELLNNASPLNVGGAMVAPTTAESDRNIGAHSLNFRVPGILLLSTRVRFEARAFVKGHELDGGGWVADRAVTVEIPARRDPQLIEPILIGETVSGDGIPPSFAEFVSTLQGAIDRLPIPSFTLASPRTIATSRDLATLDGWKGLLFDLHNWAGTSSQYPGIIVGLVKFNGAHPIGGIGIQRYFFAHRPKFISNPDPVTFAHEMVHSFGISHANCGNVGSATVDGRLPPNGLSDEAGANVTTGGIVPAGRGELQSYCGGTSRWPSVATYDIVYDNMPI